MTLEQEILQAEARRFDAILRADAQALRDCLAERMVYVHSNGVVEDRETYIALLVSGERKYLGFEPGARRLVTLGTDCMASVGELQVQGVAGPVAVVATAVYERGEAWRMVLWHACPARRN